MGKVLRLVEAREESKATSLPEDFCWFWEEYPRKEKKGDAFKAWRQTVNDRPVMVKLFAPTSSMSSLYVIEFYKLAMRIAMGEPLSDGAKRALLAGVRGIDSTRGALGMHARNDRVVAPVHQMDPRIDMRAAFRQPREARRIGHHRPGEDAPHHALRHYDVERSFHSPALPR